MDFDTAALTIQTTNAQQAVSDCEADITILDAIQDSNNKVSDNNMNAAAKTMQGDRQVNDATQQSELAFETTVTQILAQAM